MPNIFDDIYTFYFNEECKNVNSFGWIYSNINTNSLYLQFLNSLSKEYTNSPYKFILPTALPDVEDSTRLAQISLNNNDPKIEPYNPNDCFIFVADKSIISILYDNKVKDTYNTLLMLLQVIKDRFNLSNKLYYLNEDSKMTEIIIKRNDTIIENPSKEQLIANCMYALSTVKQENINEVKYLLYNTILALFNGLNSMIMNEMLHHRCHSILQTGTISQKSYDFLNFKINQGIMTMQNNNMLLKETFGIVNGLKIKFLQKKDDSNFNEFDILTKDNSAILISYYSYLKKNEFILEDITTNIIYEIDNETNIINNKLLLQIKDFKGDINKEYRIKYKNSQYYKDEYSENTEELRTLNDAIQKNINNQKSFRSSYDMVDSSYKNIDYISYIYYVIFLIILFVLLFGNAMNMKEIEKVVFSILMLFLVIFLYIIYIWSYHGMESFLSNTVPKTPTEITTAFQNNNRTIYDEIINIGNNVILFAPIVSVNHMYIKIMNVMEKDLKKLSMADKRATINMYKTQSGLNQKWFDVYKNIAFIWALTMFSIIILVFYILSVINPSYMNLYVALSIILSIFIIFYYFYFLTKHVRTRYYMYYFVKMKV